MKFHLIDTHIKYIYSIYQSIKISFKLNYIQDKIHKYVNFEIYIEKVSRA